MPRTTNSESICPDTSGHVTVRCLGCNALWRTKNIGWRNKNEPYEIVNARTLFPAYHGSGCICSDNSEFPLVHVCGRDCGGSERMIVS